VILWRRAEPRFKKVVRPEQPLEKIFCSILDHESMDPGSPCRRERGEIPRLAGIWAVPHRESKLLQAGGGRWFGLIGGTFPLYPSILRPGTCTDGKGKADVAYKCSYPDLVEFDGEEWRGSLKGKHFRLRDDVEEAGYHEDRLGHPVYIVRNGLGETFRLAGVYARLYHVLREKGGWVGGADLVGESIAMFERYAVNLKEILDRMSQEMLEDLSLEYGKAMSGLAERVLDLVSKLDRGEVEELPPPGTVPADIERVFTAIESQEFFFEVYTLSELVERWEEKFNGNTRKAFSNIFYWFTGLALGLLVYEALIVEMGIE
jgi:hypothetical protein